MVKAAAAQANTLVESFGQPIKQYPGQVQVTRAVKVKAPGKHFNGLPSEYLHLGPDESCAKFFPRFGWGPISREFL